MILFATQAEFSTYIQYLYSNLFRLGLCIELFLKMQLHFKISGMFSYHGLFVHKQWCNNKYECLTNIQKKVELSKFVDLLLNIKENSSVDLKMYFIIN